MRYLDGIGSVNRQLHLEALDLLYSRNFVLKIGDLTFAHHFDLRNFLTDPCYTGCEWRWDNFTRFLPGLDWSRVKKLRVDVGDSEFDGYWQCVWASLKSMSCLRYGVFKNVKRLEIDIANFGCCGLQNPYDDTIAPFVPVPTTVDHIYGCLWELHECWLGLTRCDITVPEWAMDDELIQFGARAVQEAAVSEPTLFEDMRLDPQLFNILADSSPVSTEDERLDWQLFNILIDEIPIQRPDYYSCHEKGGLWDRYEHYDGHCNLYDEFDDWYVINVPLDKRPEPEVIIEPTWIFDRLWMLDRMWILDKEWILNEMDLTTKKRDRFVWA
ncbi:MAG: hypothetical protein Q9191_001665 [Dirinaria sp. TL-2023a]